jgi:RNA polymerase sigma factor (sigma-70 family)
MLYDEVFPAIASFIGRQRGSREDAEDIFQDAVIILMNNTGRAVEIRDRARYVMGIAKHLWLQKRGAQRHLVRFDAYELALQIPDTIDRSPEPARLLRMLQRTGRKCLDLLSDFYFAGLSVKQLAARHGFSSEHSASVQKYKCIEKIRTVIKSSDAKYEDFLD